MIFVHELGHFLVAKACGVKCEKFYVGFDFFDIKIGDLVLIPRSLVKYQWGETEYGIGILPLGGYVKMLGQDDDPRNIEEEIKRSQATEDLDEEQMERLGALDRDKMDPRSFLAKSVLQRMAIISAGVIFNLITAVLFAAVAFKSGVNYNPPIVGDVVPGGPAWEANLYGAHVSKVGDSVVEGYFPFIDLAQEVALSGGGKEIGVEFNYPNSTETHFVSVTPRLGVNDRVDLALIGVERALTPTVTSGDDITLKGNPAAKAEPPFEANDVVVEISGEPIESIFDLKRVVAAKHNQPLEIVVDRKVDDESETTEKVKIKVGVNPMRSSGLVMEWGPVSAIQVDSPALGKIQVGDQITKINGQPVGDLFTFEQRMTRLASGGSVTAGENVETAAAGVVILTVQRDGKEQEVEIVPRVPLFFANLMSNQPVAINSVGVAIESTKIVATSGVQGLQAGDKLTNFEILLDNAEHEEIFKKRAKNNKLELEDAETEWVSVRQLVQTLPPGFKFTATAQRGATEVEASGETVVQPDAFLHKRGFLLILKEDNYRSPTWGDAIQLGATQAYKDASRVFQFLSKLVGGKISPKNLGGPGMIAAAATSEATQGTSRLLLFLTLLSANLAIVNFFTNPGSGWRAHDLPGLRRCDSAAAQ